MRELRRPHVERKLRRIRKAIAFPFWLLFWLPAHIIHTVAEAVWTGVGGGAGAVAGILATTLGLAIAGPVVIAVVAFALGLVLALVPLVAFVVTVGLAFALLTWPLRYYLWRLRRQRAWRRWFYGLDEPGEKEDPWEW